MLHGVCAATKAFLWLSSTAVLTLLTQCASPLTFGNDTKANVETGLSQVILKSVTFSNTYTGTGFVPSQTPITATLEIINPKNLNVTYTLSGTPSANLPGLPTSPTVTSPTRLTLTFTPALGAELSDLTFTLGKTAASIGKTFPSDTFTVHCDTPPSPVGALLVGTNATKSFIEFTNPTASTDLVDLPSFVIAYQDVTASTAVETVTYPATQLTAVIAELATAGANQRYFMPSDVVAGHAYTFWVTVVDLAGQKSSTQINSSAGVQYTLTFDLNDPVGNILTTRTNFPNVTVALPAAPTRVGYAFNGWDTVPGGGGTAIARTATTMTNNLSNATLYAQWVAVTAALSPTSLSLVPGNTQALTATISPVYATAQTVNWVSSNTAVATVDASGNVTAVGVGSATITATAATDLVSATCPVTVGSISVTGVTVAPTTLNMVFGAGTQTVTPTVAPANATNQSVTWLTSNAAVATVVGGVVTAVGGGTATITAKTVDGNFTAVSAVTVTVPVTGVTADQPTATLYMTTAPTTTLTATVAPAGASNPAVTWSSGNTAVATVNSGTGLVTAVASGTAVITATTVDGGFTSTSNVTVLGQGSPTITFSLAGYQTLSFSTPNQTIAAGTPLVISPTGTAASGTGWSWYINGTSTGTSLSSYTVNSATPGYYTIDVTVTSGGVLYSGSLNVTVTQ